MSGYKVVYSTCFCSILHMAYHIYCLNAHLYFMLDVVLLHQYKRKVS